MKKLLLYLIIVASVNAQSFSLDVENTELSDTLNSEMIFNIHITNNSGVEKTFDIIRTRNDLPDEWSSSLCFTYCFAPFLDSISTTRDFGSSPISPGETREVSVHVFSATNPGTAHISIKIKNDTESQTVELTANSITTGMEQTKEIPYLYKLGNNYPNPFNPSTNIEYSLLEPGHVKLLLYNANGELIRTLLDNHSAAGKYKLKIDMNNYASGIYFLHYSANNFSETKKIILEK